MPPQDNITISLGGREVATLNPEQFTAFWNVVEQNKSAIQSDPQARACYEQMQNLSKQVGNLSGRSH